MKIGVALPQMARGWNRENMMAWCRGADEGPYSSVSAGERITFFNAEMVSLLGAAAVLTERVEIFANVAVAPWHRTALLAKQLTTIDVLSNGRAAVALGVGGRKQDFDALGAPFERRHQRLDDAAADLRSMWAGDIVEGAEAAVGPAPMRAGGIPLLASPLGPKSMNRCAQWADGLSAFTLTGDPRDAERLFTAADSAWQTAGRTTAPQKRCGFFYCLGEDAEATLQNFAYTYLEVFGVDLANTLSGMMRVHTPAVLREVLDGLAAVGCDEAILVPASADPTCLARATDVIGG
jgi:alkanesulfonate monooxygenase SsuD/methylene tetrahydromethanopterin reductase-like flavin-dependent oxidoreductase (luciferase family)